MTNRTRFLFLPLVLLWSSVACGGAQEAPSEPTPPRAQVGQAPPAEAPRPEPEKDRFQEVRGYLRRLVAEKKVAGAVAMVSQEGKVLYLDATGMQDVQAAKPMSTETIFRICSMTKPITSVAVMMLVEEGKIALSDPLSKFIPEFKRVEVATPDPAKQGASKREKARREITVHDLLTHKSGITYGFLADPSMRKVYRDAGISDGLTETKGTIADQAKKLASVPLIHQPGAAWSYGLSTDVLGRVVEVASGKTLEQFFYERMFKPLQMNDTHFHLPAKDEPRLAAVYEPTQDQTIARLPAGPVEKGGAIYSASYPLDPNGKYFSGGAGLVSTVKDYGRFAQMLLNGGELDGAHILKKETVDLMTQNQIADVTLPWQQMGDGFGLGFAVVTEARKDGDLGSVGTFSWSGFYNTYFWVDPQKKLVGIVMTQLHPSDHLHMSDTFRKLTYAALSK
ncbi:serine hydrolase [Sorangium cellulosum]|uniref:Serine hydrolase n=1 Tax=Sorangium cellulosum TaxID=56 RepID=A0A2L0EZ28_SORCE|nr:serine hydrolase domain-containing protein [Sorangium cellulosum]AUX44525.1 serine hydrolase [Sorangium cellulosum]